MNQVIRAPPHFQLAARFVQPLLSWVGTATRQKMVGMSNWWRSMKIGILWYIDGICNLQRDLVGVSLDYFKVTTTGFLVFDRKKGGFHSVSCRCFLKSSQKNRIYDGCIIRRMRGNNNCIQLGSNKIGMELEFSIKDFIHILRRLSSTNSG